MKPSSTTRQLCVFHHAPPPCALQPNQSLLMAPTHLSLASVFLFCRLPDVWSYLLRLPHTSGAPQQTPSASFNLHNHRVRRASGFLLTALSNARPAALFLPTLSCEGRASDKALTFIGTDTETIPTFELSLLLCPERP
jgi:hypothetical protein